MGTAIVLNINEINFGLHYLSFVCVCVVRGKSRGTNAGGMHRDTSLD